MSTKSEGLIHVLRNSSIVRNKHSSSPTLPTLFPRVAPGYSSTPDVVTAYSPDKSMPPIVMPFQEETSVDPPRVYVWAHLTKTHLEKMKEINFNKEKVFAIFEQIYPNEVPGPARDILFELMYETLRFCRVQNVSDKKTSSVFSIFYVSHQYFRSSLWRTAEEVYKYFKETILLHTVQRPPKSAEILEPHECRNVLIFFCGVYLRHLPLLHLTTLPNYSLLLSWDPEIIIEKDPPPPPPSLTNIESSSLQNDTSSKRGKSIVKKSTKK